MENSAGEQRKPRSACADAQAGLSFRCSLTHYLRLFLAYGIYHLIILVETFVIGTDICYDEMNSQLENR